ncbi:phosphorylase b kinase gamma catalytic chain, partial [Striga asiatica]
MEKSERRKKIISQGTDRLALITGRIQTLDPDPPFKSTSFSTPRRDPPPAIHARSSSEPRAVNQEPLLSDHHLLAGADSPDSITRHDNNEEFPKENYSESNVGKLEGKEAARLRPECTKLPEKPLVHLFRFISLNEINFSIISSEDTRAICSVVLAILVVLSYITLPPNEVKPKSLLAYKPLYVVLLTDVFIVCVKLAPYAHIRKEYVMEPKMKEDGDNWGGAVKLLEFGLVLHQTIRALFIDCSFYFVVVVFGLS